MLPSHRTTKHSFLNRAPLSARRLVKAGLAYCLLSMLLTLQAADWMTIVRKDGKSFEAKVVNVAEHVIHGKEVILQRKSDGKTFSIPLQQLSDETKEAILNVEDEVTHPDTSSRPDWEPYDDEAEGGAGPKVSMHRGRSYFPYLDNHKSSMHQAIPMGPIGGAAFLKMGENDALITELDSKSPGAQAGLLPGDRVTGVNGKEFTPVNKDPGTGGDGIPRELGLAIIESQSTGKPLVLMIKRQGDNISEVSVEFEPLPDFSPNFPVECERSAYLRELSTDWLVKQYGEKGNFGTGNNYANAMAALALLSNGDRKHQRLLRDVARKFSDSIENGVSGSNWIAGVMGIYLAEYHLATGDRSVLEPLRKSCEAMAKRVNAGSGRMGHNGSDLPYGGKGLVITSAHAHLLWALAKRCDLEFDNEAWALSYKSIEASLSSNGSVGYNFSAKGSNQSAARTGCMITALSLAGENIPDLRRMKSWIKDNHKRSTNGHATTSLGLVFGFMGSKQAGSSQHQETLNYHKWLFALCSPSKADHGAYYYAKRGNFTGDGYLNYQSVANYQMLMLLNSGKTDSLWVFGNRQKDWLGK